MALNLFSRKSFPRREYRLNPNHGLPEDSKIPEISTILELSGTSQLRRPDHITSTYQTQQFSIDTDEKQAYAIELGKMKMLREYFSISRVSIVFFGLYPKDTGMITLRLKNTAYKEEMNQVEFSCTGGTNRMWGMVASMNHAIHKSDIDNLYIEVILTGTGLHGVIIGEIYALWEFTFTDVPMLYKPEETVSFAFSPLDNGENNSTMAKKTWDLYKAIADKKKAMSSLQLILNNQNVTVEKEYSLNSSEPSAPSLFRDYNKLY